ncbi:hypothetical protein [Halanaerobium sp. ST460_2HS_T2]|uniref:hypothetical protein n=1 Tax=Halanaerobium sp. ST460_2HS_T2 TaxID=2183914 RepID=UPI000DF49C84|nr:hypothetical protein [Halanaerobium sp. ST460_2HS_T2]RCW51591.1 hypothetical protein DFR80_1401 [Halanaerobium sp. ST460_2HS_T2]
MNKDKFSQKINKLSQDKLKTISALKESNSFISSALTEAAYCMSYSLFERMNYASKKLPKEFETIDNTTDLKQEDRRFQPFIRSYLFVALIAELENYLSDLLFYVLVKYPGKIENTTLEFNEIIELKEMNEVIKEVAKKEVHNLLYKSPKEYKKRLDSLLSMEDSVLENIWPDYIEMKARRDIGVHNSWYKNELYENKISKVNIEVSEKEFLGVNNDYFEHSLEVGENLITIISNHCNRKFS